MRKGCCGSFHLRQESQEEAGAPLCPDASAAKMRSSGANHKNRVGFVRRRLVRVDDVSLNLSLSRSQRLLTGYYLKSGATRPPGRSTSLVSGVCFIPATVFESDLAAERTVEEGEVPDGQPHT